MPGVWYPHPPIKHISGYTFTRDRIGGAVLHRESDNASTYYQPGDDAEEAEMRLVGMSGFVSEAQADIELEGASTLHTS